MNTVKCANQSIVPSKIICIGRNYVAHAKELGNEVPSEPVIFIKPNSAISSVLNSSPHSSLHSGNEEPIHYEGELCFMVVNKQLSSVGFGLDLTKRETQSRLKAKGLPWERAKSFNGAAVFSEFVPLAGSLPSDYSIRLTINGRITQEGGVADMMFKPDRILEEVLQFVSLEDGDIIMTGTPEGVGAIDHKDVFVGEVLLNSEPILSQSWKAV